MNEGFPGVPGAGVAQEKDNRSLLSPTLRRKREEIERANNDVQSFIKDVDLSNPHNYAKTVDSLQKLVDFYDEVRDNAFLDDYEEEVSKRIPEMFYNMKENQIPHPLGVGYLIGLPTRHGALGWFSRHRVW